VAVEEVVVEMEPPSPAFDDVEETIREPTPKAAKPSDVEFVIKKPAARASMMAGLGQHQFLIPPESPHQLELSRIQRLQ
jgi:hypothetical protein